MYILEVESGGASGSAGLKDSGGATFGGHQRAVWQRAVWQRVESNVA